MICQEHTNMTPSLEAALKQWDWKAMEAVIRAGICECIANVAKQYPDQIFFGFALDCQVSYGSIGFSFGTTSYLDFLAAQLHTTGDILSEPALHERVWSLGDWPIDCVNEQMAPRFTDAWRRWEEQIEQVGYQEIYIKGDNLDQLEEFHEHLLTCFAKILHHSYIDGDFHALRLHDKFRLIVIDHDETLATAFDRINAIATRP